MTEAEDQQIGPYKILGLVGRGGSSVVYKAHDTVNDRVVAIKVLSPNFASDENFALRFRREYKVILNLKHPNIVPVLDFGHFHSYSYLVMPYYEEGSLADRLESGHLTLQEGARTLKQICHALEFAHKRGIIHRDIKPGNILFDSEGNAVLTDFGLAHINDASISLTGSTVLGTPAYISPEQARGEEIGPETDQYSMGVILYQLVTEHLPFHADSPMAVLFQHVQEPLPRPSTIKENVPELIEHIIIKATAKNPANRFRSIQEFNRAFQAAIAHIIDPKRYSAPQIDINYDDATTAVLYETQVEQERKRRRNIRAVVAAATVMMSLLVCSVAFGGSNWITNIIERGNVSAVGSGIALIQPSPTAKGSADAETTNRSHTPVSAGGKELIGITGLDPTSTLTRSFSEGSEETDDDPDPTATMTTTSTSTLSPSPTKTDTPEPTPVPSKTPTPTWTSTQVPSLTSTNTPTSTPNSSPTNTATATATATMTDSPTPVNSPTTTPTITDTPPPTPVPCSLVAVNSFLLAGSEVKWALQNNSAVDLRIISITLSWPDGQNEELKQIKFDNKKIWEGDIGSSPMTLLELDFRGNPRDRNLRSGTQKWLKFKFGEDPASSGYILDITFMDISGGGGTCTWNDTQ